jgi:DNA replication and repair protein RecF
LILESLELLNYRNYPELKIEFIEGNNLILGRNAQGKSNLLESIYFLSHQKSFRASRMRDLVLEGRENAYVKGVIIDDERRFSLKVGISPGGRTAQLNGQIMETPGKARGVFKCVMFSPDDLYLVKGDPSRRREFMDETVEGLGPVRAQVTADYRRALKQRNALLRDWEKYGRALEDAMDPWDDALSRAGAAVVVERRKMLSAMSESVLRSYEEVTGAEKKVELGYRGSFEAGPGRREEIEKSMRQALSHASVRERKARTTLVGPHRDEVEIRLGGRDTRALASQGEQRTLSFCLRIAQKEYLESETGRVPVMLLDDVFSELDSQRRKGVLRAAGPGAQSLVTATEMPAEKQGGEGRVFVVEKGSVSVV